MLLLTFVIFQTNATQILASTMVFVRRKARKARSNVIVPGRSREGDVKKV